jgi:hypothetical protein
MRTPPQAKLFVRVYALPEGTQGYPLVGGLHRSTRKGDLTRADRATTRGQRASPPLPGRRCSWLPQLKGSSGGREAFERIAQAALNGRPLWGAFACTAIRGQALGQEEWLVVGLLWRGGHKETQGETYSKTARPSRPKTANYAHQVEHPGRPRCDPGCPWLPKGSCGNSYSRWLLAAFVVWE